MKAYDSSSLVIALNPPSVMGSGLCLRRGLNRANNGLVTHCGDEKRFMVHADQLLGVRGTAKGDARVGGKFSLVIAVRN